MMLPILLITHLFAHLEKTNTALLALRNAFSFFVSKRRLQIYCANIKPIGLRRFFANNVLLGDDQLEFALARCCLIVTVMPEFPIVSTSLMAIFGC